MRLHRPTALFLATAVMGSAASGEDGCAVDDPSETIVGCFDRLFEAVPTAEARSAAEVEEARRAFGSLFLKTTGLDGVGGELGTAIEDFLPLLTARIDSGAIGRDESGLSVDLNNFLGLSTSQSYKLQAVIHETGTLFEPLQSELEMGGNAARVSVLEDEIDPVDDASFVLAFSPVSERLGRSHRRFSELWYALFDAVVGEAKREAALEARVDGRRGAAFVDAMMNEYLPWTQRHQEALALDEFNADVRFAEIDDAVLRADLAELVARTAADELVLEERIRTHAEAAGFFRFADLVANQPQLTLKGIARVRDDLVGPDRVSGRLGFEMGFANVNAFRRTCVGRGAYAESAEANAALLECFGRYWRDHEDEIARGDRFSAWVEYTRHDNYRYTSPADAIAIRLDGEDRIEAGLIYGRYVDLQHFFAGEEGSYATRVDLSARYEGALGDETRQDRVVGTLVLSQRLLESLGLAVNLSWANKPEFRTAPDAELFAGIGFQYKLFRPER